MTKKFTIEGDTITEIQDQFNILMSEQVDIFKKEKEQEHDQGGYGRAVPYGKYRNCMPLGLNSDPRNFFIAEKSMLTREAQIKLSGGAMYVPDMPNAIGILAMKGITQIPIKPKMLVIQSDDIDNLVVYDIKIGRNSMLCSSDTLPAAAFKPGVASPKLDFDSCHIGQEISVTLAWATHVEDRAKLIVAKAMFFGATVE